MLAKTKKEFQQYFKSELLPMCVEQEKQWQNTQRPTIDRPLRRETWNNVIDELIRDRQLPKHAENWCAPW